VYLYIGLPLIVLFISLNCRLVMEIYQKM